MGINMKLNLKPLARTLTGRNKAGRAIYGVLDLLPIPQFHDHIRDAVELNLPKKDIAPFVWAQTDKVKLAVFGFGLVLSSLVAFDVISVEDARSAIQIMLGLV